MGGMYTKAAQYLATQDLLVPAPWIAAVTPLFEKARVASWGPRRPLFVPSHPVRGLTIISHAPRRREKKARRAWGRGRDRLLSAWGREEGRRGPTIPRCAATTPRNGFLGSRGDGCSVFVVQRADHSPRCVTTTTPPLLSQVPFRAWAEVQVMLVTSLAADSPAGRALAAADAAAAAAAADAARRTSAVVQVQTMMAGAADAAVRAGKAKPAAQAAQVGRALSLDDFYVLLVFSLFFRAWLVGGVPSSTGRPAFEMCARVLSPFFVGAVLLRCSFC